ncbi:hypothetical protein [Bradyrhizobium erythrophlei]|jgi:hypothetical protein|uniref:Uncharacterized protein n=1 Tax=Bradyrhizobium erythrophlei TaxID=1437360 RepID=A0A1M5YID3_9BRAD|nr:hypothetical protein [Bradyrhizobium erythrophlei]SHI11790.1 hypothetical protein SAMN05443248_8360 [Bradyrhizobium erythrophlei]
MRRLAIGCLLLSTLLPTAAFSRGGGMGGHHSASTMGGSVLGGPMTNSIATGGAAGTSLAAPGTNASGTALSGGGTAFSGGPALGTGNPSVDSEDRKAAHMVSSICKGC